MTWILGALIAFLILDALQTRGRSGHLSTMLPTSERWTPETDHVLVVREGVTVPPDVERAARAHADAAGLDVLELLPPDLPAMDAVALLHVVDPRRYRRQPFAPAATALHAALVSTDVCERASVDPTAPHDAPAFLRLAQRLKPYACRTTGVAVAPGLCAAPIDPRHVRALLREAMADAVGVWALWTLLVLAVLGVGVVLEPAWGAAAIAVWHLYPLVAIGPPLRPRDRWAAALLRLPRELATLWRALFGPRGDDLAGDEAEASRAEYAAELAAGPEARPEEWFEPRREDCPQCDGRALTPWLDAPDRYQLKPGRFHLDRCDACGTVFQNPRLTPRGLTFYYRDFYEGIGARSTGALFSYGEQTYVERLSILEGHVRRPARWLDVGTGRGHFPCKAKELLPDTTFDGLDVSGAVETGARQRWIAAAWRGLFPDIAPRMAGRYDVVSLFHCLEHTLDPREDVRAARTALAPGGHLIIEVPDPASRLGRILRSWWLPWLQPQHVNLLTAGRLETILREEGFDPVRWQHGEPHAPIDFGVALSLVLFRLAPRPGFPWRPPARPWHHVRSAVVWTLFTPAVAVAMVVDRLLAPLFRRAGWSNAYRVLARRGEDAGASGPTTEPAREEGTP